MQMERDGWVYAAREEDAPLVKIGFTGYATSLRLRGLRAQCHAPVIILGEVWIPRVARHMERALHKRLASSRIEGEWFYLHMSQAILERLVEEAMPAVLAQVEREAAYRDRLSRRSRRSFAELEEVA